MRMLQPRCSRAYSTCIVFLIPAISTLLLPACLRVDLPASHATSVPTSITPNPKDRSIDNLVAFTRLLGYVRHFHPSDQAATANWDNLALNGIPAVERASTAEELAAILESLFEPIAPTVRVFPAGNAPPLPNELVAPADRDSLFVTAWVHYGFGQIKPDITHSPYSSERVRMLVGSSSFPSDLSSPGVPFHADLGAGVEALVPMALYADADGTLPHVTTPASSASAVPANERTRRIATVALIWNIMQHFYPYFVVKVDWPQVLRESLAAAATDSDEAAFIKTLERLMAKLNDGHALAFAIGAYPASEIPPWDWIENQMVLTHVNTLASDQLHVGDVMLKIEGQPVAERLAQEEDLISGATPQWKRYRALMNLWAKCGDDILLEVKPPSGQIREVNVRRSSLCCPAALEPRPEPVTEVQPGIMYLDLTRIDDARFASALANIETARGIIFDMRGYPQKIGADTIGHLIDEPVTSAQWHIPRITAPDHAKMTFDFSNWSVPPKAPRLKGKVAFLTDGRAISYAETYLGIIEHYKLAEIVGGPTAGTNGNVAAVTLFGRYRLVWTGMQVLKHDGSQHHGIGILPTVPVSRTIRGVIEGRDEVLERALQVVNQ